MSFTWGAVVGLATPIPYFYSVFFITVLIHRCGRDFERCVSCIYLCFLACLPNQNLVDAPSSMERTGNGIALLSNTSSYLVSTRLFSIALVVPQWRKWDRGRGIKVLASTYRIDINLSWTFLTNGAFPTLYDGPWSSVRIASSQKEPYRVIS